MNDNHWYPRDPSRYLMDTDWCDVETEVAHNRMFETYIVLDRPIKDEPERIQRIGKIKPQDYQRVRGNLLNDLGWFIADGVWRHKGTEETMAESKAKRESQRNRTAPATAARNAQRNVDRDVERNDGTATTTVTTIDTITDSVEREAALPEIPDWNSVRAYADRIALVEWKARDWFDEMEGSGWLDHNRRQVCKWQSILNRVKTRWEADGRPMQQPGNPNAKSSPAPSQGPKLSDVMTYAKEKWGDDPKCGHWASSFFAFWASRKWQHKDGKIVDWKIKLGEQIAKWRRE